MITAYHNKRDSKGRFAKVTQAAAALTPAMTTTKRLVNKFAIVVDRSGSMASCWNRAIEAINQQIADIGSLSRNMNQQSLISLVFFDNAIENPIIGDSQSFSYNKDKFYPRGGTALNDAILSAIDSINTPGNSNEDVTWAVVVVTDGYENSSRQCSTTVASKIRALQATDRWSFIFNCPQGSKEQIANLYSIPDGNIKEWEGSVEGIKTFYSSNSIGTQSYFSTRASGGTKTFNYFNVNATAFATNKIGNLRQVSPKHNKVEKEVGISDFFTGRGTPYYAGMAYYELTKSETVQVYKKLILLDKVTGLYYMDGPNFSVRQFLAMPNTDCKIDPMNVGQYRIFVQSTSDNRKLVRGTTILHGV